MNKRTPISGVLLPLSFGLLGLVIGFGLAPKAAEISADGRRQTAKLSALVASPMAKVVSEDSRRVSEAADAAALRMLWEEFAGNTARDEIGREMVLARWAVVDADDGFEFFREEWDPLLRFLTEWAVVDLKAMATRSLDGGKVDHLPQVATVLAWRNPEICLAVINVWKNATGHDYSWPDDTVKFALIKLYSMDEDKAVATALALSPDMRGEALEGIAVAMARKDAVAAMAWAKDLDDPTVIDAVMVEIGKSDPQAVVPLLAGLEQAFADGAVGEMIFLDLASDDPRAAMAWITRHFENESGKPRIAEILVQSSLLSLGERQTVELIGAADKTMRGVLMEELLDSTWSLSLEELMEGLDGVVSADVRAEMRVPLLGVLAADEAERAVEYIRALPAEEVTAELWLGVLDVAGDVGFVWHEDLFLEGIGKIPEEEQSKFLGNYFLEMAFDGSPEMLARLAEYRDHPGYAKMVDGAVRGMGTLNPDAAMAWIESMDGELQWQSAKSFAVTRMGSDSVVESYEWLRSLDLPMEYLKPATNWLVQRWAGTDGIAASKFIQEMEPGPLRQQSIIALIWENYQLDPEAALEWVAEIDDEEKREYWRGHAEAVREREGRIGDR